MRKQILSLIISLSCIAVEAQVSVSNLLVSRNGEKVEVSFEAQISPRAVSSNYKLLLTPRISSGANFADLSPMLVEGFSRRIVDLRNNVSKPDGVVLVQNGEKITYASSIDFLDWMKGSSLHVEMLSEGCCGKRNLNPYKVSEGLFVDSIDEGTRKDSINISVGNMNLALAQNASLPAETISSVTKSDLDTTHHANLIVRLEQLTIMYAVGSKVLDPNFKNNKVLLDQLISDLSASKNLVNNKIEITGYASPEGSQKINNQLAYDRAVSLRNYIIVKIPYLLPSNFIVVNGGVNWGGLRKLVSESTMKGRERVIDIIDNTSQVIDATKNTSCKKELMDLEGGQLWYYMLRNFYPALRGSTSISIYQDELRQSDNLKLKASFPLKNQEIINQAILLIGERKATEALDQLKPIESDPRSWNPMGVSFVLLGDLERARAYLTKAADAGFREAKSNLLQLDK